MIELDATVQANQCTMMPISRSGYAEADLLERYPELAAQLEKTRQILIDSVALRSRLHEDEARAEKLARHSTSTGRSPQLLARASSSEFLFDMDEDGHSTSLLGKSPLSPAGDAGRLDTDIESSSTKIRPSRNEEQAYSVTSEPSRMTPHGSIPEQSPTARTAISHTTPDSPSQDPVAPSTPWGNTPLNTLKLDMKQIMAQASEVRRSGISTALAGSTPAKEFHPIKVSQKERKRQRQQQQQEIGDQPRSVATDSSGSSKQSPWQVVPTGPKVLLSELAQSEQSAPTITTTPTTSRSYTSPSLTLRQTVSGKAQTTRKETTTSNTPQTTRSISQPSLASSISHQPPNSSTSTPTKPHSIRHNIPISSAEPSLQLSMDDILAQQQQEKFLLKEVIAKRSLLEIQEEQAFQDWWDKEEAATKARMQEEEEAVAAARRSNKEPKPRGHRRESKRVVGKSPKNPGSGAEKQSLEAGNTSENAGASAALPRTPEKSQRGNRGLSSGGGRQSTSRRDRRGGLSSA